MKVLIVHNTYQQRGGEDVVVEAESALLASRGHEVRLFSRSNADIGARPRPMLGVRAMWSATAAAAMGEAISSFAPQVMHVHNTFAVISPSVYWAAARAGVPVVQTLHNFRLLCPQATFLRNGAVCEDCLGHLPWRGAVRGCYRESRALSTMVAATLTLHRALGTWRHKIARYIALNEFCRRKFIEGGLPADRIEIKPNFVELPAPAETRRDGFLYVGRLSAEKGLAVLVAASAIVPEAVVRVAGAGPESESIARHSPRVQLLGSLQKAQVQAEMSRARALVIPSICQETFSLALIEAFGNALPVIASRAGALPELVEDGLTGLIFQAGDSDDLARKIRWADEHPDAMAAMGRRARARYEEAFCAEPNYRRLMEIYAAAIESPRT